MKAAMHGEAQGTYMVFLTIELLRKVVTSRRLGILPVMTCAEINSSREVARRVDRDVKAVHADVRALVNVGIVEDTGSDVSFGHVAVRVEFTLQAA